MSESNDANARLKSERDAARGEAEDFRRAWAILREDENQRMPATAEEGARQFRALRDREKRIRLAMRAYRAEWGTEPVAGRLAAVIAPLDLRRPLSRRTRGGK